MITQKFKGDDIEIAMEAAAAPAFELCSASLSDMAQGGYESNPFLLMLYDNGKMPFSDRVPRDSFVAFFKEALGRFPFTGTFESYLFILQKVFGAGSGVLFNVTAPGKLSILVNASAALDFDFTAVEFTAGAFEESAVVDQNGSVLSFTGISGIDSQYELSQLLAELIPAGIYTTLSLTFFILYNFISSDSSLLVTGDGDEIVFIET